MLLGDLGVVAGPGTDAPVRYEAGRLPFLAHALRGTWRERHGSTMTVEGYRKTGGIRHAIATTADKIFAGLNKRDRLLAKAVFLRLIKVSGDSDPTRRRLPQAELTGSFAQPPAATAVMNAFVDARLLTRQQDTVQITHDVLLHSWPELEQWLEEDPTGHLTRQEVEEAATAWDRGGREPSRLYRGDALRTALEWATDTAGERPEARYRFELSSTGAQFLDASRRHEQRTRKIRRATVVSLALLVVIASIAGLLAWRTSVANERQLHTQGSHMLGRASRDEAEPVRSLQLALAAWHNDNGTQEAYEALFRQYLAMGSVDHIDHDVAGGTKLPGWTFSADGGTAAMASRTAGGGTRLVVQTGLLGPAPSSRTIAEGSVGSFAISRDGKTIAFVGPSGSLNLWTGGGDPRPFTPAGATAPYRTMADSLRISPDNRYLLLWARPRAELNPKWPTPLAVVDLTARRVVYERHDDLPPGFDATFGAGSDTFVEVAPAPSTPVFTEPQPLPGAVIRIATGEKIRGLPAGALPAENGATVVTCDLHGTVHVVAVATGADKYVIPSFPCPDPVLDRSGRYLFGFDGSTADPYRAGIAVDLVTRKHYLFRAPAIPEQTAFVATAAPDHNGDLLIRRQAGKSVLTLRAPEVPDSTVDGGRPDPTGRYALRAAGERHELVDLADGAVLGAHSGDFTSAAFTADGNHVVAVRGAEIAVFDTPYFTPRRTIRLPAAASPCVSGESTLLTPQDRELALVCGPFLHRWDAGTGAALGEPVPFGTKPDVVLVRPGHPHEVVTVQADVLRIRDVERRLVVKTVPLGFAVAEGTSSSAVIDTAGAKIAILSPEGGPAVWDLESGARIAGPVPVPGHLVAFGRGDTVLAEGWPDVTAWDFARGFVSTVRITSDPSVAGSLRVEGDTLVVDTRTAPFAVTLNPDTWFAELCRAVGRPLAAEEITKVSPGALTDLPCA
ncbi:hypothetical protein Q5425_01930 [Amycolatopsis sp. A133]|nr:hypothetical protein [Amycolatopsis sp. A133]MDQ7802473.1 hypothetical protein [Amycolatopsis sp. A133]